MIAGRRRLFDLGTVVASRAAVSAITDSGDEIGDFLGRHARGDWGAVTEAAARRNDANVVNGSRCESVYRTSNGIKIRIVTEHASTERGGVTRVTLDVEAPLPDQSS